MFLKIKESILKRKKILSLAFLLILFSVLISFYFFSQKQFSSPDGRKYAKAGKIVKGFPEELIFDKEANIVQSYSLNYNDGRRQKTVILISNKKIIDAFKYYRDILSVKEWSFTNIFFDENNCNFSAHKNKKEMLNVMISQEDFKLKAIINYITTKNEI